LEPSLGFEIKSPLDFYDFYLFSYSSSGALANRFFWKIILLVVLLLTLIVSVSVAAACLFW
jgi:hypothetical protein